MNQKQSKRLKRLLKETSSNETISNIRYNEIKNKWDSIPRNERHKLIQSLREATKIIKN